jgi:hypothetical protein
MEHFAPPDIEPPRLAPTPVEESPPALAFVEQPEPKPALEQPVEFPPSSTPSDSTRTQAMEVLARVVRLQTVDGKRDFAPLESCRDQARALLSALESKPDSPLSDEARALALGEHPFCSLLTVALGTAPMDDGEWALHHSRISGELGRELAIAAARARLVLAD